MARDLDAIIKELDAGYSPSRQLIDQRIAALPGQADAEIEGLKATAGQAYEDILAGARNRGVAFGGIPIAEQARYNATTFTPAVARVRQSQNDVKTSLFGALNDLNNDQRTRAMSLRQQELDRDEQQRQFNEQLAAQERERQRQAAEAKSLYGALYGGGAAAAPKPAANMARRSDGGFNFTDASGKPISAAMYAQQAGIPIGEVLRSMAQAGDSYAANAYRWIQSVQNSDAFKRNGTALAQRNFGPLFWGVQ